MRVMIAIQEASAMEKFLEYKKSGMNIHIVDKREQLMYRLNEVFDIVAVDCGLFHDLYPWEWMVEIKERLPVAEVYICLNDIVYDAVMLEIIYKLATDFGFHTIPCQETVMEVADKFANVIFGKQDVIADEDTGLGKFITTISGLSGDGSTTMAENLALSIATKTKLRVGLIDGNLKSPSIRGNLNLGDREKSNFPIRPRLQTGTLEPVDLMKACVPFKRFDNLFVLPGSHRRETATDVRPEMVMNLMNVARRTFHITIMDVQTFPDNAATICGVRGADMRLLVAQNNYVSYKASWGEWFDCYWKYCGLVEDDFKLVLNRSNPNDKKAKQLAELIRMDLISEIPNVSGGLGFKAVHEGLPLYLQSGTEAFISAIDGLASLIVEDDFIHEIKDVTSSRMGFFKKLFK